MFKAWQSAQEQMEKAHLSPQTLAAHLVTAYSDLCRLQEKTGPSARVRLSDVHFQTFVARQTNQTRLDPKKSKVKDYPRAQFLYDLSMLLEQMADNLTVSFEGRQLTFHQASKSAATSRTNSIKVEYQGEMVALSDLEIGS